MSHTPSHQSEDSSNVLRGCCHHLSCDGRRNLKSLFRGNCESLAAMKDPEVRGNHSSSTGSGFWLLTVC